MSWQNIRSSSQAECVLLYSKFFSLAITEIGWTDADQNGALAASDSNNNG